MIRTLAFGLLAFSFTASAAGYNFDGIVRLSQCSGSLVRFETSRDSDMAMVLTNGHCLESGFLDPGVVITHQPIYREIALMTPQGGEAGLVTADEIIFAAMTKTDMALYRLTSSYAQILTDSGVHPLSLSSQHPTASQSVEVISGYWRRGYSCSIGGFVYQLLEGGHQFKDSIRYSQPGCEVRDGTSGSPMIQAGTRTVLGVNNTVNTGQDACTDDNPCEVDASGLTTSKPGQGYAQETYWLYTCLDNNNRVDISKPGCELPH